MMRKSSGVVTSLLGLAVVGLLLWSPTHTRAQRPDRTLVQTGAMHADSARRVALVIGNGAYTNAPPLKNPPNDARDMAATLKQLGFTVASAIDADQRTMKRLIREFGQQLKSGGQGLFYYAGHGVQLRGRNYLIPANAEIASETDVEDQGVDLSLVLGLMDEAENGLNIVILDACRNNPFARSFRSAGSGLAQVDAPSGTLIAYATSPGRVASDGQGRNGLYTSELLSQMRVTGIGVEEMFKRVRAGVQRQTSGQQVPWESSSLVGDFYFRAPKTNAGGPAENANETKFDAAAFELSYWETIKNSTNGDDFKAYLEKYPNGQFAELARRRMVSPPSAAPPSSSAAAGNHSVVDQYIKSGDELVREQKWADAEVEYRLAVRLDPTNAEWHNKLGFALQSLLKFSEAEAEYRTALRLVPNNPEAHYGVGRALREQKKLVEAESEIREALRLEPVNAKYHASLGNTLRYRQKYAEAEAEFGQAIRLEPNNAQWHGALSAILEEQKKHTEAETEAREALRLAPTQSWAHSGLSRLLLIQDKNAEAETEAREAVRLDPKNAYGHWVVGTTMLNQKKDAAEAEASLTEAVRLQPNVGIFHHNLGVALERQKKTAEAEAEYKEALRVDPAFRERKKKEADELARQTKSFKGSWGIKSALGNFFSEITLVISPNKIQLCDTNGSCPDRSEIECSAFAAAVVDKSSIREIAIANGKFRFNAKSPAEAASALAEVQRVCKAKQ